MINFEYPSNDLQTIIIMNGEVEVGKITHDNVIPKSLLNLLEMAEEQELVNSVEKPEEYVYLNSILIKEEFRKKGFFKEAVKQFEALARDTSFEAITLNAEEGLSEYFESQGYAKVGYLPSVNSYIMKKDLFTKVS